MNLTLATLVAVDSAEHEAHVLYPNLSKPRSAQERRCIYWKTATVCCATVRRCYPEARLCVFTNDPDDLKLEGVWVSQLLERLGVERCFLPFQHFKPPPGVSRKFLNIFYRLDVLEHLANGKGHAEDAILLMDGDIVSAHRIQGLADRLPQQGIWVSSPFAEIHPYRLSSENLSRAQVGDIFRRLEANYPNPFPIWYGGEFIGGRRAALQALVRELERVWALVLERALQPVIYFPNRESFFDNDEYLLSYIFNSGVLPITLASEVCRRMTTLEGVRDIEPDDAMIPFWHVPSEKRRGLALLFTEMRDPESLFWKTDLDDLHRYLGDYVGIPKRRYDLPYTPQEQMERYARIAARWLRRKRKPPVYSHHKAHV